MLEVALDPGKATGLMWRCAGNGTQKAFDLPEDKAMDWLIEKIEAGRVRLIVCESFVINMQTVKKGQDGQSSIRQIGVAQHWSRWYDIPFVLQTPAEAKSFATDEKLKRIGWWTRGSDHARDASRHMMLYLAKEDQDFRQRLVGSDP